MQLTDKQAKWFYFFILPFITISSILNHVILVMWFCIFGAISVGLTVSGE